MKKRQKYKKQNREIKKKAFLTKESLRRILYSVSVRESSEKRNKSLKTPLCIFCREVNGYCSIFLFRRRKDRVCPPDRGRETKVFFAKSERRRTVYGSRVFCKSHLKYKLHKSLKTPLCVSQRGERLLWHFSFQAAQRPSLSAL